MKISVVKSKQYKKQLNSEEQRILDQFFSENGWDRAILPDLLNCYLDIVDESLILVTDLSADQLRNTKMSTLHFKMQSNPNTGLKDIFDKIVGAVSLDNLSRDSLKVSRIERLTGQEIVR